jgi:hypothetical protein
MRIGRSKQNRLSGNFNFVIAAIGFIAGGAGALIAGPPVGQAVGMTWHCSIYIHCWGCHWNEIARICGSNDYSEKVIRC